MKAIFIGDAHGMTKRLEKLAEPFIKEGAEVFQLGDMGLGFPGVALPDLGPHFHWIRGNHDDPAECRKHPNYLGEYGYVQLGDLKMFYISGAQSIDKDYRIEGVSWWPDEELSLEGLQKAKELYAEVKPDIVMSHEVPTAAVIKLLTDLSGPYFSAKLTLKDSRTSQMLQQMIELHEPKLWIFGHYHVDKGFEIKNTRFQCVAELSALVVPDVSEVLTEAA